MPQVQPPAPQPMLSDIQLFAKAYFNLELTKHQLDLINSWAHGRTVHSPKAAGKTTARNVFVAYIQEGLKPGGRVRLPQHPLPPREKPAKGVTQEGRILAMIKRPGGAYNFELSRIALKYTSVISDLRKDGHAIVADRQYNKHGKATNTWRYRMGGQ